MKAVGMISSDKSATGHKKVQVFFDEKWAVFNLANESEVPSKCRDFGLFEFDPADQFCRWIDPNKS